MWSIKLALNTSKKGSLDHIRDSRRRISRSKAKGRCGADTFYQQGLIRVDLKGAYGNYRQEGPFVGPFLLTSIF